MYIRKPFITEKSLLIASQDNIYMFEVEPTANKHQIATEVEAIYGVKVVTVRTTMQAKKVKRTGKRRMNTTTTPKKKAYVQVKAGQKIDVFEIAGADGK